MRRLLLAISISALLFSCGKKLPSEPVKIDSSTWQIPVTAADTGTPPAGKDKGKEIATITVAPSSTPTEVKIFEEDLNLFEKTMTNKPKISVTAKSVQDKNKPAESAQENLPAPQVKVNVPEKSLFKRWLVLGSILLVLLLAVAAGIYSKVKSFSPLGIAKQLLSKLWPW